MERGGVRGGTPPHLSPPEYTHFALSRFDHVTAKAKKKKKKKWNDAVCSIPVGKFHAVSVLIASNSGVLVTVLDRVGAWQLDFTSFGMSLDVPCTGKRLSSLQTRNGDIHLPTVGSSHNQDADDGDKIFSQHTTTETQKKISIQTEVELRKSIKFTGILAILLGNIGGASIFIAPTTVLSLTGSPGLACVMWCVGGLVTMSIAVSVCELALLLPRAGGPYFYTLQVFGNIPGFIILWGFVILIGFPSWALAAYTGALYSLSVIYPDCTPPESAVKLLAAWLLGTWTHSRLFERMHTRTHMHTQIEIYLWTIVILYMYIQTCLYRYWVHSQLTYDVKPLESRIAFHKPDPPGPMSVSVCQCVCQPVSLLLASKSKRVLKATNFKSHFKLRSFQFCCCCLPCTRILDASSLTGWAMFSYKTCSHMWCISSESPSWDNGVTTNELFWLLNLHPVTIC